MRMISLTNPLQRAYASKAFKTPPMADSITEGTLSKWLFNIGDFVKRDDQIATIETDKVDVHINAVESGTLLEKFSQEGDTVIVGGDLYKLDLADSPSLKSSPVIDFKSSVKLDGVEGQGKVDLKQPIAKVIETLITPNTTPISTTTETLKKSAFESGVEYFRTPLIKFLGSRKFLSAPHHEQTAKKEVIKNIGQGQIFYEDVKDLPRIFQRRDIEIDEIEAIEIGMALSSDWKYSFSIQKK